MSAHRTANAANMKLEERVFPMHDITPTVPRRAVSSPRGAPSGFSAFGATHPGRCRETNDDAFRVEPSLGLVVVADGVATTQGGGTAARVVVDTICDQLLVGCASGLVPLETPAVTRTAALQAALFEAHRRVREEAERSRQPQMATTVVALWCTEGHAIVMHAGDSRAYRLRAGALEQLTPDHTVTAEYERRKGSIPPPFRQLYGHVITRAVSARLEEVHVDVRVDALAAGDAFVLCSDGLTGGVSDAAITAVVETYEERDAAELLVALANDAGGADNITVAVARPPA